MCVRCLEKILEPFFEKIDENRRKWQEKQLKFAHKKLSFASNLRPTLTPKFFPVCNLCISNHFDSLPLGQAGVSNYYIDLIRGTENFLGAFEIQWLTILASTWASNLRQK